MTPAKTVSALGEIGVESAAAFWATIEFSDARIFAQFAVTPKVNLNLNHDLRADSR